MLQKDQKNPFVFKYSCAVILPFRLRCFPQLSVEQKSLMIFHAVPFSPLVLLLTRATTVPNIVPRSSCTGECINQQLSPKLSEGATIVRGTFKTPRWSEFHSPQPGTVVNGATETDVLAAVSPNLGFIKQLKFDSRRRSNSATRTNFPLLHRAVEMVGSHFGYGPKTW